MGTGEVSSMVQFMSFLLILFKNYIYTVKFTILIGIQNCPVSVALLGPE